MFQILRLEFPKELSFCPLPDRPETGAFLDGPVVLAGLCEEERTLVGNREDPTTILTVHNEREWGYWKGGYRTIEQEENFEFKPLYQVMDETYTVYFPVKEEL